MTKKKGNRDGEGGRNESCQIGGRKEVPRRVAVQEVILFDHLGRPNIETGHH